MAAVGRRVVGLDEERWQPRENGVLCRKVWRQDLVTDWLDTTGEYARDPSCSSISCDWALTHGEWAGG